MAHIYVKLEENGQRCCFVVDTARTATELDQQGIRPFVREGVKVTCLRKEGAHAYDWGEEAEK